MSRLFQLKSWLTLEETAKHLSGVLGEDVQLKDIYRLTLDGHLQLSVNFVNKTSACVGPIVGYDQIIWYEVSEDFVYPFKSNGSDDTVKIPKSQFIGNDQYVNFGDTVQNISGVWDLLMFGGERLDIEHFYQMITGGPEVTLVNIDGAFVKKENQVASLQVSYDENEFKEGSKAYIEKIESLIIEENISPEKAKAIREDYKKKRESYLETRRKNRDMDYHPAAGLPNDSVLVVKTLAIMEFLQTLNGDEDQKEKPLKTKEKNSLLVMIAALCNEAGIDPNTKGVASAIEMMTDKIGAPLTDDTIRKILKQLDDAVTARSK